MAVAALSTRRRTRDWSDVRVTLMGLGRHGGGLGAARFLARRGAKVTISDAADRAALAESLAALADVPLEEIKLGGHDERDFSSADAILVNPAVRPDHPCLRVARENGVRLTSEIELLLDACPANVIGVTGSNGKSTTVTMLAEILRAAGRRTWLGGNLGGSLLDELDAMSADDWAVVELSSFQLAHLSDDAPLPKIAVVTNCTPNHLDWHGDFERYAAAKRRLLQSADAIAILNPRDPVVRGWGRSDQRSSVLRWLDELPPLAVPGEHNRQNAACAAAAAEAAGIDRHVIVAALSRFRGLEHRLQWVGECDGVRYYNDSKATSPEASLAAVDAIVEPVWLLAGGVSKGAAFDGWARRVVERARGAAVFGACREELAASLRSADPNFELGVFETLAEACDWCRRQAQRGDAILLSPACASHDQFHDFADRGRVFCGLARLHNPKRQRG